MTKRRVAWIVARHSRLVGIAGAVWSTITGGRIVLTAAELQERVNRALPREFKGVTVDGRGRRDCGRNASICAVEVRAAALGRALPPPLRARGMPVYEAERGELFFEADNVAVSSIRPTGGNLAERSDRSRPPAPRGIGRQAGGGRDQGLPGGPGRSIASRTRQGIVLKAAVANVAIESDRLVITVSLIS